MRQRVHETGLPEVFYGLSFVLTPRGIRARWDRSGPNPGDNIYVDQIPVIVADPAWNVAIKEAEAEVEAMMAEREAKRNEVTKAMAEEAKEAGKQEVARHLMMPKVSWTVQATPPEPEYIANWDGLNNYGIEDEEDLTLAYDLALEALVREGAINAGEAPDSMCCEKDPDTEVDSWACANCPFVLSCFDITTEDIGDKLVAMFGPNAAEEEV